MSYATPQAPAAAAAPVPQSDTKGLSTFGVVAILTLGTTAVAFADVILRGHLTYITGIAFVLFSAICALMVCKRDLWTAVITPPIAFLIALIASGQIEIFRTSGDLLIKESALVATGLAFNAPFIFGGTILALIIVLVRRKK